MRLLIVEDDTDVADSLVEYLCGEGVAVDHVDCARAARSHTLSGVDLIILDWMLPDGSGLDLLREWRRCGEWRPVILLTARTELPDRVLGLELGADDYVSKPFEPRELLARIRVQLRERPTSDVLCCGPLSLNVSTREVRLRGVVVELSRQEHALLELLIRSPNKVYSREEILNRAWGYAYFPTTRTVDTHVLQLRQKLDPALIETVRGIGYRLRELTNS